MSDASGTIIASFMLASACVHIARGIDHRQGDTFICRDGSASASKKSCEVSVGAAGLMGSIEADI